MQCEALLGFRNRVFNQCIRKATTVVAEIMRTRRDQIVPKPLGHFAHAQIAEQAQGSMLDVVEISLA